MIAQVKSKRHGNRRTGFGMVLNEKKNRVLTRKNTCNRGNERLKSALDIPSSKS